MTIKSDMLILYSKVRSELDELKLVIQIIFNQFQFHLKLLKFLKLFHRKYGKNN